MLALVLDRLRDAWTWLTDDLDSTVAAQELDAVAASLTVGERYLVGVTHVAFAILWLLQFMAWLPAMVLAFALLEPLTGLAVALALGVIVPPLVWFLLRRPIALAKSALLRVFVRRAGARASLALDATSASGAPVAISVDVDHERSR